MKSLVLATAVSLLPSTALADKPASFAETVEDARQCVNNVGACTENACFIKFGENDEFRATASLDGEVKDRIFSVCNADLSACLIDYKADGQLDLQKRTDGNYYQDIRLRDYVAYGKSVKAVLDKCANNTAWY